MVFRVFKQVPKIIYGEGGIRRLKELLPPNASSGLIIIDGELNSNILTFLGKDLEINVIV